MKKNFSIFIILLTILMILTSCGSEVDESQVNPVYKVNVNNTDYTVDTIAMTISDQENTYTYSLSGDSVTVFYPDGSSYWWKYTDIGGHGGWSDDYDAEKYVDGDTLITVLESKAIVKEDTDTEENVRNPFGLLFAALGVFNIVKPEKAWYYTHGWRYKGAEPSDEALTAERLGGGVLVIIGILLFFF